MSYHSYIGGEYIETTGGDSKIFSRENIEYNSVGIITSSSDVGHSFNEPKPMPPMEINNMYVKVRIKEPYNGEFGFDWIDVSPDDKKDIQKIQDVDFSNVEYFYKEGATDNDLGDIVEKSSDEDGAKNAVIKNYKFNNICKYVDMPFVLIKPLQEITLTAEIILREGEIKDDEIKITGDDFYDFEIVGGTKEGKTSIIKVAKAGKIDFKIKCLKEGSEKRYNFYHNNPTSPSLDVGGVFMMENKVLKLKFRVIALVSSDNNPNEKAKALFKKFKESKVKEYLNENSLNQAGYEVEIENYNEMDNADVDDYFYAFDKEDWKTKGLFKENFIKKKKTITQTDDGKEVIIEKNDVPKDVLSYEDVEIDYITIEEYNNKLKTKNKIYNGGVIILADFQADNDLVAFSRPNPLNHYLLFMYSNSITQSDCYSHEMGHMLGLPHSFYTNIEKETYKSAKENILGNGLPVKNPDGTKNDNYRGGINVAIEKAKNKEYDYMNLKNFYSDKKTIEIYINNFNNSYKKKLSTINYTKSDKEKTEKMIRDNTNALIYLKESEDCSYKNFKIVCHILVDDYYKLSKRFKKYLLDILKQINLNQLFFKQKTTKNTMDYRNTRLFFTNTQIRIMRDDSINSVEVLCNCNNGKKK